jgi:hypothetical protein
MPTCKGCGKEIIWGLTAENKKIPLDARAPVYFMAGADSGGTLWKRHHAAYVTHFATCSKAKLFSASWKPT